VGAGTAVTYPLAAPYTTLAATDHVLVSNLQGAGTYAVSASVDLSNTTGGAATITASIWLGGVPIAGADITLPDGGVDNLTVPLTTIVVTADMLIELHILTVTAGINVLSLSLLGGASVATSLTIWEPGVGPAGPTGATGAGASSNAGAEAHLTTDLTIGASDVWQDALSLDLAPGIWLVVAHGTVYNDNAGNQCRIWDGANVYGSGLNWSYGGWGDVSCIGRIDLSSAVVATTITLQLASTSAGQVYKATLAAPAGGEHATNMVAVPCQ
jgi:hypothetical protein